MLAFPTMIAKQANARRECPLSIKRIPDNFG